MKQALIYIGMLLLAISCGQNRDRLHTGDLLFQAGKNTEMTGAITAATAAEFLPRGDRRHRQRGGFGARSHDRRRRPAHAIGGISRTLRKNRRPAGSSCHAVEGHGRHRGCRPPCAQLPRSPLRLFVPARKGETLLQRTGVGKLPRRKRHPAFHGADGTLPQFWADLFDQLGEQVPEGLPGTNPNDMAREELLEEVHRYF